MQLKIIELCKIDESAKETAPSAIRFAAACLAQLSQDPGKHDPALNASWLAEVGGDSSPEPIQAMCPYASIASVAIYKKL